MSSLRRTLEQLAMAFAESVLQAVRDASVNELLVAAGPIPGFVRRSDVEVADDLDQIVALLKDKQEGLRSEEIRSVLGIDRREMPRVLKEGLSKQRLRTAGKKRWTRYMAA